MTAVLEAPVTEGTPASPVRSRPARVLVWSLAAVSFLSAWAVAYTVVIGAAEQHSAQVRLYATFREQLAQGVAPLDIAREGRPVALLHIAGLGLDQVVVEGVTSTDLELGPGHRRGTVLPGQSGTSVVYGKAATFGAPFARLAQLHKGDAIMVTTSQGEFTYHVSGFRRAQDPQPKPVVEGTGHLVLVTATGSGALRRFTPHRVLFVDATLSKAAPAARPTVATIAEERVFAADRQALFGLVCWLLGLVAVVIASVWTWGRWGRWQCWVAFSPVVVAVLVGASGPAAGLLPNLL